MGCQGGRGTSSVLGALACAVLLCVLPAQATASISVGDVQVTEANSATEATFTLTRQAGALAPARTVSFQTTDGSASSPADFTAASGTRTFGSTLLGGHADAVRHGHDPRRRARREHREPSAS